MFRDALVDSFKSACSVVKCYWVGRKQCWDREREDDKKVVVE